MTASWETAPARLAADAAEIHVWLAELDAFPPSCLAALTGAERERAARLVGDRHRRRWVAARAALRVVLGRYLGAEPAAVELTIGDRGKPGLRERPLCLRFNLSHSGGLALVAVTGKREVGIDIELEAPRRDFARLAEVGLDSAAAIAVQDAPAASRSATFYAAWVRHEATVKCRGLGLGAPGTYPPTHVRRLEIGPNYAAALAVAGTDPLPLRHYLLNGLVPTDS